MLRLLMLAALATIAAAGAAPVAPAHAARPVIHPAARPAFAARDWSQIATRLPSGTFLLGNPQAKVKVAEYLSLTCPHCAHMADVAIAPMVRDYVRTGRVSYEARPASRDPVDLVAIALARCAGPRGFYALVPTLYAAQPQWVEKGYSWLQSAPQPEGRKPEEMLKLVAAGSGLDALFAAHGMPAARQAACFAGPEPALVSKMAADIWKPGFAGTPTFQVNGRDVGVLGSWDDLKAKLVAAGA